VYRKQSDAAGPLVWKACSSMESPSLAISRMSLCQAVRNGNSSLLGNPRSGRFGAEKAPGAPHREHVSSFFRLFCGLFAVLLSILNCSQQRIPPETFVQVKNICSTSHHGKSSSPNPFDLRLSMSQRNSSTSYRHFQHLFVIMPVGAKVFNVANNHNVFYLVRRIFGE
jgi:hypothetical protein